VKLSKDAEMWIRDAEGMDAVPRLKAIPNLFAGQVSQPPLLPFLP
jgi:hypothetical protein